MDVKNLLSSMHSKSNVEILAEIHERVKSIHVSEIDVQRMIESAKKKGFADNTDNKADVGIS